MTSLISDYSNNILTDAIDISNKLKTLIKTLNEKNQNIKINIEENEKILLPAGVSSDKLTNNKTLTLWKNSLRN